MPATIERKLRSDYVKLTTRFGGNAARANKQNASSRSRSGERFRRRTDDLTARRGNAQHSEAALVGTVGTKAEDAVDAGKAGRIGENVVGEMVRAVRFDKS